MDAEEKNMNEILSVIVADLFDKSKGELSPKIHRLRDEIKKVIEGEETIFGKFHGLVESFREIIPDEKQRYHAAIKALSTTSKLSRKEIVAVVNNQLEELTLLEKGLMPALPDWRNELKVMEATTQEIRGERGKLRERIVWLESEEQRILTGMAARKKEAELAEKAMWELFRELGAEMTLITKKVEEATAETPTAQPIAQRGPIPGAVPVVEQAGGEQKRELSGSSAPGAIPVVEKTGGGQKIEIGASSAPQDSAFQKKCPMCGGRMDFFLHGDMWQCYSCAYEELKENEVQGKSLEEKSEQTSLSSNENQESKKESSPPNNQPSTKKKACPVCRKKMQWHEMENTWRCPFCDYERRI